MTVGNLGRRAWRTLRTFAAAPGALAMLEERVAEVDRRIATLGHRVDRLDAASRLWEIQDRARDDQKVGELIGSLIELNEALRRAPVHEPAGTPATGAGKEAQ